MLFEYSLSLRSPASSGRIIPFPVDNRNEWNQQFMLVHKWILFSILFPVQLCYGCQCRYLHGADLHAGQRLGTGLPEVFSVEGSDPAILGSVPGSHQVAIVGEGRAKEGMTVHIIRAYLQAEPAFQAFGGCVLMSVVTVFRRLVFPDIHIGLLQILINGGSVDHQIMNDRKFTQRPYLYVLSLQIPQERFTGKGGFSVNHHGASPADSLKAGAFPADACCRFSIGVDRQLLMKYRAR